MSDRTRVELQTDPSTRILYATDNSIYQIEPEGVLLPSRSEEIATFLADNFVSRRRRPMVARGAGTGTNGQSLTDGVVIEFKRHMNRLLSVDPESRTAVVEPGMVTGALNAELAELGLLWAPHTSTLNRATVGGMISTDAAGKGSLVHGRAHRHVVALDVVLDDGTRWRAEPTPVTEVERRAGADDRTGRLWRDLLDLPLSEDRSYGLPELARGFSGYGIDRVRRTVAGMPVIDPVPLLCGAEGTLAVITAATLALTPIPAHTVLVIAGYDSFVAALDDAVELAPTRPTAVESFDETTLERGRSSPAWPALGELVGDRRGSVLLIEFSGGDEPDTSAIEAALAATGRSYGHRLVTDPETRAEAWKVRADAVGLLAKVATGGPGLSARPTAMVEDCAVPVAAMPAFIAGFRRILDGFDLEYGMFGHADVGCVHVRPALDLTDAGHEVMVRTITDRVVALVAEHGGILWGEHGRGFRGESADSFLPPETIELMRRVKSAFDPEDLLNPGKLYRPLEVDEPLIPLDRPPKRGTRDRSVPLQVRTEFSDAFACNGNGLCHHYDQAEVMCPSYKATGDPALSPRGRADLLRAWLAGSVEPDPTELDPVEPGPVEPGPVEPGPTGPGSIEGGGAEPGLEETLARNLDQCLSCAACLGHCPVEVDIPELKSRFFERFYRDRRRPMAHRLLARFETVAGVATRLPGPMTTLGAKLGGSALGLVDLPAPKPGPGLDTHPRFRPGTGAELVILPDVFTARLEPATLAAAVDVLGRLDYEVAVARFRPSGKFDHVKGRRDAFAAVARSQADLVRSVVDDGATPTVVEPAIGLLHHHEYRNAVADYPPGVRNLAEVIDDRIDRLPRSEAGRGPVTLLGHCTERVTAPGWPAAWARILTAAGYEVTVPRVGCCGMAGIFGHERDNQEMSRRLFEMTWADHVLSARPGAEVVATGYSCRSQADRFASRSIAHPVTLL